MEYLRWLNLVESTHSNLMSLLPKSSIRVVDDLMAAIVATVDQAFKSKTKEKSLRKVPISTTLKPNMFDSHLEQNPLQKQRG